jgi:hypothetical protein
VYRFALEDTHMRVSKMAVTLACVLACSPVLAENAAAEKKAVDAATAWLALVDAGKYAESWEEAATLFRSAVPKDAWVRQIGAVRGPLGALVSRTLTAKTYSTSLPGAPDGEYVVVRFRTEFKHKAEAVETVTPTLDKDGTWRVSGYYIK